MTALSSSSRFFHERPDRSWFISPFTLATALVTPAPLNRLGSPSRSSTASRVPVEAPEGTPATRVGARRQPDRDFEGRPGA